MLHEEEEKKHRYFRILKFTFAFIFNFSVLAHVQYVELVIVSSILYFVRGIYAHVVGGVGTCTRACSCACTTCTTAS